jgi:acyl-CoA reductase-like NAD-dependent aldehyde dehydrogenase
LGRKNKAALRGDEVNNGYETNISAWSNMMNVNANTQITTINPFTETPIKSYPYMTEAEAMTVVEASHRAFLKWRETSSAERAAILQNIAKRAA